MAILLLLASLAFQDDAAVTESIATFDAEFAKNKESTLRVSAIQTLASMQHEKIASKLGSLLGNADKGVRLAATQALGAYLAATPELKKAASKQLQTGSQLGANQKDPESQSAILVALGQLQEESAANTIKARFEDKNLQVAVAAIGAAGSLKSKELIEPMIKLLKECEKLTKPPPPPDPNANTKSLYKKGATSTPEERESETQKKERARTLTPALQGSLGALTQNSGFASSEDWEKWWAKAKGSFIVPK